MNISEEEFTKILDENQDRLLHLCRVYAQRPAEEMDLFQEITIQVWHSLPSFNGHADISTWMYRIAINTAISQLRKKKTRKNYYDSFKKELETKNFGKLNPETIEQDPQTQKLYRAISELNVSERAVITMYLDDFSYKEISFVTGMTENYVGVKLNRIKEKLTKLIGD